MNTIFTLIFIGILVGIVVAVVRTRRQNKVQVVQTTPTVNSYGRYGSRNFSRRGDSYYYDDGSLIEDLILLAYIMETLQLEDGQSYEMTDDDYARTDSLADLTPMDTVGPVQAADMDQYEASTYEAPEPSYTPEPTRSYEPSPSSYDSGSSSSYDSGGSDFGGGDD